MSLLFHYYIKDEIIEVLAYNVVSYSLVVVI